MANLTITVPDDKVDELKAGFLKALPNESADTDINWIKSKIKEYIIGVYKSGKRQLAVETIIYDDVIEE